YADLAGMEDAGRDQVQHRLLAVHHERVAGVVAAVEAHDHVRVRREEIDDLALTLVAPLGADDDRRAHQRRSRSAARMFGTVRSSARVAAGTTSSTWIRESAIPPTRSRPSSMPAMLMP